MRFHLTARLRLTLLLSALFLCSGAILLALNYSLMRYRLELMPVVRPLREGDQPPGGALAPTPGAAAASDQLIEGPPIPISAGQEEVIRVPAPSPAAIATLRAVQNQVVAASLRELVLQSALALAVMAGLVVWLSWAIAGRVLRPVQQITAVARRLSEEQLHERIGLQGPQDELKELADTFDGMLARLERAFAAQGRFAASASHELRTPLAIIRTEVDVTLADPRASADELRAMGETVRVAVNRSERLIDGLLTLARSEQTLTRHEPADLARIAGLALEQGAAEAEAIGLRCEASLQPAPARGDTALLERLVANLVENAVRHNRPGGLLRVATRRDGAGAVLVMENDGLAIPSGAVNELFLPFRRGGGDRIGSARGAGLGLAIARSVAEAHQGTLLAWARAEGGLRVELRLPGAGPP